MLFVESSIFFVLASFVVLVVEFVFLFVFVFFVHVVFSFCAVTLVMFTFLCILVEKHYVRVATIEDDPQISKQLIHMVNLRVFPRKQAEINPDLT